MKRFYLVLMSLMPLIMTANLQASARDWYVATNGNNSAGTNWDNAYTDIQWVLNNVGDEDTIYLAGQTFALTDQLVWTATEDVTISGGYAATNSADMPGPSNPDQWPTVLTRANPAVYHRIFQIQNVTNGTLEAVTITDGLIGAHGGGIYVENASLTMNRCDINANFTSGPSRYGGGIYFHGGTLLVTNGVIRNNSVHAGDNGSTAGGGIWIQSGTAMIRDSIIKRNSATTRWNTVYGGGVVNNTATLDLVNCLIVGNRSLSGSAVYSVGASSVTRMLNCTIAHNMTGAAVHRANGTMTMTNSIVWRNPFGDLSGTITLAHSNIEAGTGSGSNGNISSDPGFEHGYYLAAGSTSRNAGTGAAFLLDSGYTTRITGEDDTGTVDLGYHYRQGMDLTHIDLYVCPETGDNQNSGTSSNQPLRTITYALTQAIDGGRIHLASGMYGQGQETFPLVLADRMGLSLLGQGPTNTLLNATNSSQRVMDIQLGGQSRIEGVGIMGGRAAQGAGVRLLNASHVTLANCEVLENVASSSGSQGAGIYTDGGTLIVTNSIIRNNLASGPDGGNASGGGVWVNTGVFELRDSELRENRVTTGWRDPFGGGLHNVNGSVSLVNSLITANRCLNASAINNHAGQLHILNSTITDNQDGPAVRRAGGTLSVTNSILWNNASDIVGTVSLGYSNIQDGNGAGSNGNISANPLFEFGYYLAEGSPSRDAGTNATFLLNSGYTTRITGEDDTDPVDMGYHYRQGVDLGLADIYVSNAGSNANSGTNWAEAFQTITHALTKAINGSRIHVAAGTYAHPAETFPLNFSGLQGISLLGAGSDMTTLNATGSEQRVLNWYVGGSSRIEGLTLTGGHGDQGGGIHFLGASDVIVRDCIVSNNTATASHPYGGGVYVGSSTVVFEDGRAWDNLVAGTYWNSQTRGAAFYVASGANLTLNRVDMRGNSPNNQGWREGTIYNLGTLLMRNCVVARNTNFASAAGVYGAGGSVTIESSTIVSNSIHGVRHAAGTVSVTNSIVWNNGTSDLVGDVQVGYSLIGDVSYDGSDGNICANPLFVDADDGDYQLGNGSPAANKGIAQDWMTGATDLAGVPRIQGGKVDMGAYESAMGAGTLILFR